MCRTNSGKLHSFDPEIEIRYHRLIIPSKLHPLDRAPNSLQSIVSPYFVLTLLTWSRELVAPDVTIETFCIQYPDLDVQCELKYGLIHLLSNFHG